ncbi:MAG: tetratricopeptide repeat protein [Sulfuricaulis sp.]
MTAQRPPHWRRLAMGSAAVLLALVFAHKLTKNIDSSPPASTMAHAVSPVIVIEPRQIPQEPAGQIETASQDDTTLPEDANPEEPKRREGARDKHEVLLLIRRAAANGNPRAQLMLGKMYEQGRGVVQDNIEAYAWFKRAAILGNKQARHALEQLKPALSASDIDLAERRAFKR